jgi:isocitrate dehydrogenase (NAD+)
MVMSNLYGTIVNNTCSGIIGGMGMTPGFDVGDKFQMFRQGNRHLGLDIVNQDIANPTAILLSVVQMLKMMNLLRFANAMEHGLFKTINEKEFVTKDLGGSAGTEKFVNRIIANCANYKEN